MMIIITPISIKLIFSMNEYYCEVHNGTWDWVGKRCIDTIQHVLDSCACKDDPTTYCNVISSEWKNSTHHIDNNTCEWFENDKFGVDVPDGIANWTND